MPDASPPTAAPPTPSLSSRSGFVVSEWDVPRVQRAINLLDSGAFSEAVSLRSYLRRDPRMRGSEERVSGSFVGFPITLEESSSDHGNSPTEAMRRAATGLFGVGGECADVALIKQLVEDLAGFAYAPCWLHFEPSKDGSRWVPKLTPWPLEAVQLDTTIASNRDRYVALAADGSRIPIEGENWIEFRQVRTAPHQRGAVRALGMSWIAKYFAVGDWATASGSNAPKNIGELKADETVSSDAGRRFASDVARLDQPYSGMIHENGGKVYQLKPGELSHTIHMDLSAMSNTDFAIAYSGTDGAAEKGSTGTFGAVKALQGVAYDTLRGLSSAITGGLGEVSNRWARYNAGREHGPGVEVEIPNLDAEEARALALTRRPLLTSELVLLASRGALTETIVRDVAVAHGVEITDEYAALWTAQKQPLTS